MSDLIVGEEPYPYLTRVHHRGAEHSRSDSDKEGGWGTVIAFYPRPGGYEYEVEVTRGISGERLQGSSRRTFWGSHHIDRAVIPEDAEAQPPMEDLQGDDHRCFPVKTPRSPMVIAWKLPLTTRTAS